MAYTVQLDTTLDIDDVISVKFQKSTAPYSEASWQDVATVLVANLPYSYVAQVDEYFRAILNTATSSSNPRPCYFTNRPITYQDILDIIENTGEVELPTDPAEQGELYTKLYQWINDRQPAIEAEIDADFRFSSDVRIAGAIRLGILEILAGEFAQFYTGYEDARSIRIGSLGYDVKSSGTEHLLTQQGRERLKPYMIPRMGRLKLVEIYTKEETIPES